MRVIITNLVEFDRILTRCSFDLNVKITKHNKEIEVVFLKANQDVKKVLEEKVTDYKRFGFVLLSLSVFLFIGLIIPTEGQGVNETHFLLLITLSVVSITLSVIFHRKAMKYREQLYNEYQ